MVQQLIPPEIKPEIIYPDSDGNPMSDNTKQYEWIVKIKENLEILFAPNNNRHLRKLSNLHHDCF